jgi:hypothetical protein
MDAPRSSTRDKFKTRYIPTFPDQSKPNFSDLMKSTREQHELEEIRLEAVKALD